MPSCVPRSLFSTLHGTLTQLLPSFSCSPLLSQQVGNGAWGGGAECGSGAGGCYDSEEVLEASGLTAAAAGTLASGLAGLLPLASAPSEAVTTPSRTSGMGGYGACGSISGASAASGCAACGSSACGASPCGAGGASGTDGVRACMHATSAASYIGLSHTATAEAARASHSLSAALSNGTSATLALVRASLTHFP